VTRCLRSALDHPWNGPNALVIAGPTPIRYADFVRAVATAAGLRKPFILPFPAAPLILAARLTKHVSALPTIQPEEIRRLVEDKAFDITKMRELLRVEPVGLAKGLALTFASPHE
jgi:nucleoside-diphosphate-sugar epimerase